MEGKIRIRWGLIIFILLIGICVLYVCICWIGPKSIGDLKNNICDQITPENGTSYFNTFDKQGNSNTFYYETISDKLVKKKSGEDKGHVIMKDVGQYLVWNDRLVYTLLSDDDKTVNIVNIDLPNDSQKQKIEIIKPRILMCDSQYLYIYTEKNKIYKLDELGNEVQVFDLKTKKKFDKACIVNNQIFLVKTPYDNQQYEIYIFDLGNSELSLINDFNDEKYSTRGEAIKWNDEIYVVMGLYDDMDLSMWMTRVNSEKMVFINLILKDNIL